MAFEANKGSYQWFLSNNKLATSELRNVPNPLQVSYLPRQSEILYSRYSKALKALYCGWDYEKEEQGGRQNI